MYVKKTCTGPERLVVDACNNRHRLNGTSVEELRYDH